MHSIKKTKIAKSINNNKKKSLKMPKPNDKDKQKKVIYLRRISIDFLEIYKCACNKKRNGKQNQSALIIHIILYTKIQSKIVV